MSQDIHTDPRYEWERLNHQKLQDLFSIKNNVGEIEGKRGTSDNPENWTPRLTIRYSLESTVGLSESSKRKWERILKVPNQG